VIFSLFNAILAPPKPLNNDINKATLSYGYGISVNFMQLMKVYSIFSNDGLMITPHIVNYLINHKKQFLFSIFIISEINNPSS